MQQMYLSLARGEAAPLARSLRERPAAPRDAHWATFVRNHDELTLDKLSDAERAEVFAAFGPEKEMQLYDRGLRRRLPPMVDGDRRRLELVYSLLFTLPGTPVLFYGEEIGMGENLAAEGRQAVRTPMQWTSDKLGGFSTADPATFPNPVADGAYAPDKVNVHDQSRDPDSFLSHMRLLVERYRESPELAWGDFELLDSGSPAVLAVHNFSGEAASVSLSVPGLGEDGELTDVFTAATLGTSADKRVRVDLEPYGYRWLRVATERDDPDRTTVE
jgi:maltose alpha-D-glucosyltransferase/alpha-amylase